MSYSDFLVDPQKLPPNDREAIIQLSQKHSAFVDKAGGDIQKLETEMNQVTGTTPEDKAIMHKVFNLALKAARKLHSKRFNIGLMTIQLGGGLFILDKLGVDVKLLGPVINSVLKTLITHLN